jgi:hypothetical protein
VKKTGLWSLRVLLAVAALWSFFGWVPLLNSEPLSALAQEQIPVGGVPAWAKSFHINHGAVVFNSHGVPSEDPWPFGILVAVSVATTLGVILSFPKDARSRFFRRRVD